MVYTASDLVESNGVRTPSYKEAVGSPQVEEGNEGGIPGPQEDRHL